MTVPALPRFDTNTALSKRAKHIGVLPWLSIDSIAVRAIAPRPEKDGNGVIVATHSAHKLKDGDRIYLAGVSAKSDGYHHVVEHNDQKLASKAFFIEDIELDKRITPEARIYGSQDFYILDPDHLPVAGAMERRSIEVAELAIMEKVAPDKYRQALQSIRAQVLGEIDVNALKAQANQILAKYAISNAELSAEIGELLIQKEALDRSQQVAVDQQEPMDRDAMNEVGQMRFAIQCREIELLCSMPEGHASIVKGQANALDTIEQVSAFISQCIITAREAAKKQKEEKPVTTEPTTTQPDPKPKAAAKKPSKPAAEPTTTNAKPS